MPHVTEGVTYYSGRDMTERTSADELLNAQNLALEAVAAPIPLEQALAVLAQVVEQQSGGSAVAAIILVDEETASLRSGVGPGLPTWYHDALEGVPIAEGVGACAWAAACNSVIVTPDIANAPSWQGLSHLGLPRMDGYEVARRIRAKPAGRKVTLCAITGWGQDGDKLRAQVAGFDQHLTKPVSAAQLSALITAESQN